MIRPATLLQLAKMGFKCVPLDEESKKPTAPWTEIYESQSGGWDLNELIKYPAVWNNVATCFGKTHGDMYLNCLDIDSENALKKLSCITRSGASYSLIDACIKKTFVTKTKKGYHVYWLSPTALEPIHTHDCEKDWEFEIKTDKTSGLATLPPSRHRKDPDFIYKNIGRPLINSTDSLYDVIMRELGDRVHKKNKVAAYVPRNPRIMRNPFQLSDTEATAIAAIIGRTGYAPGIRHKTSLALSGFLCKWGCDYESAEKVFRELCRLAKDEEKQARLADLKQTYRKEYSGRHKLAGYAMLKAISPHMARRLMEIVSKKERENKNGKQ